VILIGSELDGRPLVEASFRAIVDRGGYPVTRIGLPGLSEYFVEHAADAMLNYLPPLSLYEAQGVDGRIRIAAEHDTKSMSRVDPNRQATADRARSPLRREAMKRKWVLTQFPTQAYADDAGMSLDEYTDFVAKALFLDRDDPTAAWKELGQRQAGLVESMKSVKQLHIEGPGTDIKLSVEGRTWINSDGKRNMPSGEIFTGPVEDSVQGKLQCSYPVCRGGREIAGIRLEFENGKVVRSSSETEQDYLQSMLDLDDGARRLGEIGLGLNYGIDRFTRTILYDEKIGGTVHLALGQSYTETGGQNTSALHWDLILDLRKGGRISADGKTVMEDGKWLVG